MRIEASNPEEYISKLPDERKEVINKLRETINKNLPKGFTEEMSYGMIGYVVSHSLYPAGYHCDPKLPLPFISIASQKNFVAFYHMGLYGDEKLSKWFTDEYSKHSKYKLDMGKSCIRFKRMDDIPYDLLADLVQKMSADQWIKLYEENLKR